jgi:hypothetical protein
MLEMQVVSYRVYLWFCKEVEAKSLPRAVSLKHLHLVTI